MSLSGIAVGSLPQGEVVINFSGGSVTGIWLIYLHHVVLNLSTALRPCHDCHYAANYDGLSDEHRQPHMHFRREYLIMSFNCKGASS